MRDDDPEFPSGRWLLPAELTGVVSGIALGAPELPVVGMPVGPLSLAGLAMRLGPGERLEARGQHVVVVRESGDVSWLPDVEGGRSLAAEARWVARHHRAWRPWRSGLQVPPLLLDPTSGLEPVAAEEPPSDAGEATAAAAEPGPPAAMRPPPRFVERARDIVSPDPGAKAERERQARVDVVLGDAESLSRRGMRLAALEHLREALAVEAHARLFDRLTDLERDLCRGSRGTVRWAAREVEIVFCSAARVGRGEVEVQVQSPCVSREHLLLRASADGPEVIDLRSTHGTRLGGARIDGPVAVDRPLTLLLGDSVSLQIAPWGRSHVLVTRPDGLPLVITCGPVWQLEDMAVTLAPHPAGEIWRLAAPLRAPVEIGGMSLTTVELRRGDTVLTPHGRLDVIE
ncbi:MAG: FHA domain-containing protein [Myxococcales bacterium]|nr:FHA domain-containing protein [Myxococcales bacterium]